MEFIIWSYFIGIVLHLIYILLIKVLFVKSKSLDYKKIKCYEIVIWIITLFIPAVNFLTPTLNIAIFITDCEINDYIFNPKLTNNKLFKFLNKEI